MAGVLDQFMELEEGELSKYVADIEVQGVIAQVCTVTLNRGQTLWVSRGSLLAYSEGIEWTLKVPGGVGKALGRMMTGEGAALVFVTCTADGATVLLAANMPGKLATWDLARGSITCTSGSFVAAMGDVDISVTMARSAGAMFFGGAGLFLQQLSGSGVALINGSGDFIERKLGAGEKLLVSTGNLAVFSSDVGYGVRGVGGCRKMAFGGEGLFMTELVGPGWVMLQSLKKLPPQRGKPGPQ
ncbi:MAG: AIM24 family protein [Myxococcota bacterium]